MRRNADVQRLCAGLTQRLWREIRRIPGGAARKSDGCGWEDVQRSNATDAAVTSWSPGAIGPR
ncbi:MAG TPA: hypothetical protein VKH42_17560, partial [Vicinamibacterales bacterium]|nr:hypothetical protein [Vicinamibacterales bacterium]